MKIVVDVVNSQKMKDLTEEIRRQEQEILKWNAAMKTAGPTQQAVLQANMVKAGQAIGQAKTELAALQAASGNAGRGLSQLAYAIDDVQYGFNAIVNNIPQIVMGLGGGAGIAGAVGIAAVAINQLIKHWGEMTDAMQVMWSGGSLEQLTKLREKADEATAAFEKLEKTRPKDQQRAGEGVSSLITEGPTEKILKSTMEALGQDVGLGALPHAAVAPSIGMGPGVVPTPGVTPEQAKKKQQEDNFEIAKKLLGAATTGDAEAIMKLEGLVQRHPENFPPEFLQDIKDQTPEGQKRIEQGRLERQGERNARKIDQKFAEKQKKLDEAEKKDWLENIKKNRIQSLEDERTKVQDAQREFDEKMWEKQHMGGQSAQIMQGSRSATDYYQTGTKDDAKELAKQAHDQRVQTNKELAEINKKLEKERRLVIPH